MAVARKRELQRYRYLVSLKFECFGSHNAQDLIRAVERLPGGAHIVSGSGGRSMAVEMTHDDASLLEEMAPFALIRLDDGGLELLDRN